MYVGNALRISIQYSQDSCIHIRTYPGHVADFILTICVNQLLFIGTRKVKLKKLKNLKDKLL